MTFLLTLIMVLGMSGAIAGTVVYAAEGMGFFPFVLFLWLLRNAKALAINTSAKIKSIAPTPTHRAEITAKKHEARWLDAQISIKMLEKDESLWPSKWESEVKKAELRGQNQWHDEHKHMEVCGCLLPDCHTDHSCEEIGHDWEYTAYRYRCSSCYADKDGYDLIQKRKMEENLRKDDKYDDRWWL